MSANSSIEWTDTTWNPVRGCSVISPGCVNCYAMKQAHRFSGPGKAYEGLTKLTKAGPQWTGVVRTVEDVLLEPLSWRKPRRVFVNSMSDLFHEDVPDAFIDKVFAVMALAHWHTYQVLTKRPERMREYLVSRTDTTFGGPTRDVYQSAYYVSEDDQAVNRVLDRPWPLPNVWLGVSVENQQYADERVPLLLQTPAAVRFISAEPLLGRVDLEHVPIPAPGADFYGLRGVAQPLTEKDSEPDDWKYWTRREAKLDWVIVGGESGPSARPCRVQWMRDVVAQCRSAGVPVFVKQLGAQPEGDPRPPERIDPVTGARTLTVMQVLEVCDRKGGDPSEWPEDLRVREFPAVTEVAHG
jgi:protein gp37